MQDVDQFLSDFPRYSGTWELTPLSEWLADTDNWVSVAADSSNVHSFCWYSQGSEGTLAVRFSNKKNTSVREYRAVVPEGVALAFFERRERDSSGKQSYGASWLKLVAPHYAVAGPL